jgi:hypothetical protein
VSFKTRLFPALFTLFIVFSCKSLPPVPETEPPAAETTPEEAGVTEENAPDTTEIILEETEDAPEEETETAEIVIRAEEIIEPSDEHIDVYLPEPFYDFSEPELVKEPEIPDDTGQSAAISLDEPESLPQPAEPVEETAPVDIALTEDEIVSESEAAPEEATVSEEMGEESEEPPPPPPMAALRRSELIEDVPQPSAPVRVEPSLPAREPPDETSNPVKPEPSRVIYANEGQTFEVPFQGGGWVYIGEENSADGITYDTRRSSGDTQTFVLRAQKEGEYNLRFYKQDFLRDYYTNEYVRVIVTGDSVFADGNDTAVDGETPADIQGGEIAPDAANAALESPEEFLQRAREEFASQKYDEAAALLDDFQRQHPAMNDEAWWLYGQSLEKAAMPGRDVRGALDAYSYLTREYPWSKYYKDAQNIIAFLNRFYFIIR